MQIMNIKKGPAPVSLPQSSHMTAGIQQQQQQAQHENEDDLNDSALE